MRLWAEAQSSIIARSRTICGHTLRYVTESYLRGSAAACSKTRLSLLKEKGRLPTQYILSLTKYARKNLDTEVGIDSCCSRESVTDWRRRSRGVWS
jgi:hypothetical protein